MPQSPLDDIAIGTLYTLFVPSDNPSTVYVVTTGPVVYPGGPNPETVTARHHSDIDQAISAHNLEY